MFRLILWLMAGLFSVAWWAGQPADVAKTVAEPVRPQILAPRPAPADLPVVRASVIVPAASFSTLPADNTPPAAKPRPVAAAPAGHSAISITPVVFATAKPDLVQAGGRDAPAGYVFKSAPITASADAEIVVITGSRVNLRAAPTTKSAVLGQMTHQMQAAVISRPGGGWVELHHPDSGMTGFIAARFTAPAG